MTTPHPYYPLIAIFDEDGLHEFAQEDTFGEGALLIDEEGHRWLAYVLADGTVMAARPPTKEECPQDTSEALYRAAKTLPFPLAVLSDHIPTQHQYGEDGPFDEELN